jgi:hypothetical protein
LEVEGEDDIADGDAVTGFEGVFLVRFDDAFIEEGFVAGVEVDEDVGGAVFSDLGMFARDAVGVEDEVASGKPADDGFGFDEFDELPGGISGVDEEAGHGGMTPVLR